MNPSPLVTVCLITYNHAPYIRQAIDSVLQQKTNFPVEVLIGEDESSDGTREIVLEYERLHPEKIRVILHQRKDVIHVNGSATGRWNFVDTLAQARGRYVAFLEGDDYWLDPMKLQKQADVMQARPELAVCGHWVVNVDERGEHTAVQSCTGVGCAAEFGPSAALCSTPLHPNTWLFRRFDLATHPRYDLFLKFPAGDDPLMQILLGQGRGHCIREFMSAYRLHTAGMWTAKPRLRKQFEMLQFLLTTPKLLGLRYWPRLGWEASLALLRFCVRLLADCLRARSFEPMAEMAALFRRQSLLSASQIAGWSVLSMVLAPAHVMVFLLRKIRRAVVGRGASSVHSTC